MTAMADDKRRYYFYLKNGLLKKLKLIAAKRDVKLPELIRDELENVAKKEKK